MSRIAAIRAAANGAPAPKVDDEDEDIDTNDTPDDPAKAGKPKKKDKTMSEEQNAQAIADARAEAAAEATKAANTRFATVMASEHYAGREALATRLLGTALPADEIVAALGDAPKAAVVDPAVTAEAAEEAGRKAMQEAIASTGKSGVDANGDGGSKPDEDTAAARSARILSNQRAFGGGKPIAA